MKTLLYPFLLIIAIIEASLLSSFLLLYLMFNPSQIESIDFSTLHSLWKDATSYKLLVNNSNQ